MKHFTLAVITSVAVAAVGCETKLSVEHLEWTTVHFTPDYPTGGVESWWYELQDDGGELIACNSNGNEYDASGWYFSESSQSIRVYFYAGTEWENYTFSDVSDDRVTGRFDYESSTGYTMSGGWERQYGSPCSGGTGNECDPATAWTCAYDGQATPMCQSACNYTGEARAQQCAVLESFLESGDASECCPVCG